MKRAPKKGKANPYLRLKIPRAETEAAPRRCDHPHCRDAGEYRAPKPSAAIHSHEKTPAHEYYYFCLPHVRDYNEQWNYFNNRAPQDVEAHIRDDATWNRPSWPFGIKGGAGQNASAAAMAMFQRNWQAFSHKMHEFMDGRADANPTPARTLSHSEERALTLFGLSWPLNEIQLKHRYKKLVKEHHPDLHKGDRHKEDLFKKITEAYQILKSLCGDAP